MARILIDIPDRQLDELASLAAAEKLSRAELVRRAVAAYVERNRPSTDSAFGIWKKRGVDGLEYQEKVRAEW